VLELGALAALAYGRASTGALAANIALGIGAPPIAALICRL
jgi:hypothetical protein